MGKRRNIKESRELMNEEYHRVPCKRIFRRKKFDIYHVYEDELLSSISTDIPKDYKWQFKLGVSASGMPSVFKTDSPRVQSEFVGSSPTAPAN